MNPAEFRARHPDLLFLDPDQPEPLFAYLVRYGLVSPDESIVSCSPAGEGNMNRTVRLRTSAQSLVIKQARPWVEKYPQFEAPWDRARREIEFYRLTESHPAVAAAMPRLLHADPDARLLVLSDLGTAGDYTDLYRGATLAPSELERLAVWLAALHRLSSPAAALTNREMRALNHAHLFVIPLQPGSGPDLDRIQPGLRDTARPFLEDASLRSAVLDLGHRAYLADGPSLLHGDFFPGSLVRTPDGPCVIDPEFAFEGFPEFDLGVFVAHLALARQPESSAPAFLQAYATAAPVVDRTLVRQLAGVEILRRLLGYAQLPLPAGIPFRQVLLARAHRLVLDPEGADARRLVPDPAS